MQENYLSGLISTVYPTEEGCESEELIMNGDSEMVHKGATQVDTQQPSTAQSIIQRKYITPKGEIE